MRQSSRTNNFPRTLCLVLLLCRFGFAQSGNATLTGTVSDPSGAPVSHSHVRVTQTGTGIEKATDTTSAGVYLIPDLAPGIYTVDVSAAGLNPARIEECSPGRRPTCRSGREARTQYLRWIRRYDLLLFSARSRCRSAAPLFLPKLKCRYSVL